MPYASVMWNYDGEENCRVTVINMTGMWTSSFMWTKQR